MNNNTLKIQDRSIILNGVPVNCVTDYQIGTDAVNNCLKNLTFSSKQPEDPS